MQMKRDEELAALSPADLCAEWAKAGNVAKEYSDYATKIKNIILSTGFGYRGPADMQKGTRTINLRNGKQIKAIFVFDHKLLVSGEALDERITQVERLDNGVLAESLFKYSTDLSGSTYQGLATDHKAREILKPIVEVKSRVQSMTYEAAKDK